MVDSDDSASTAHSTANHNFDHNNNDNNINCKRMLKRKCIDRI